MVNPGVVCVLSRIHNSKDLHHVIKSKIAEGIKAGWKLLMKTHVILDKMSARNIKKGKEFHQSSNRYVLFSLIKKDEEVILILNYLNYLVEAL